MPAQTPWIIPTPFANFKELLKVRPYTGSLRKDIFYLFIICAIHQSILPSIVGRYHLVDLMTPWLIVTLVVAPLGRGLLLTILGALLMETGSTAPAGMYLTAFWMIATGVFLSKASLSWRHYFPWIVTLTIAELWIILFELFVNAVILNNFEFTLQDFAIQSTRLGFGIALGMVLCHRFRTGDDPVGNF